MYHSDSCTEQTEILQEITCPLSAYSTHSFPSFLINNFSFNYFSLFICLLVTRFVSFFYYSLPIYLSYDFSYKIYLSICMSIHLFFLYNTCLISSTSVSLSSFILHLYMFPTYHSNHFALSYFFFTVSDRTLFSSPIAHWLFRLSCPVFFNPTFLNPNRQRKTKGVVMEVQRSSIHGQLTFMSVLPCGIALRRNLMRNCLARCPSPYR